ncbi:MAG: HAD family hydrolase [Oscillospiraceae bacterium]|nr:HAD family hydrolase [Oscillospiraceae bacterium]
MKNNSAISEYLVICSLDGTLLQAGYGLPRRNLDAIEQFISRGGNFTICTGRSSRSVGKFKEWLPFSAPAILCNGSYIYDFNKEKVLYSQPLKETVRDVVNEVLDLFPQIGIEIVSEPDIYAARMSEQVEQRMTLQHLPYVLAEAEDIPSPWNKVVFRAPSEELGPLEQFAQKKYRENNHFSDFQYIRKDDESVEIINRGLSKGTGLRQLCELLAIPKAKVIAIGGSKNDAEMLSAAGIKICVADAPSDLRFKMDLTVSSCLRGGVADVLERFDDIVGDYEQLSLDL